MAKGYDFILRYVLVGDTLLGRCPLIYVGRLTLLQRWLEFSLFVVCMRSNVLLAVGECSGVTNAAASSGCCCQVRAQHL
jgi:hypothetical protein